MSDDGKHAHWVHVAAGPPAAEDRAAIPSPDRSRPVTPVTTERAYVRRTRSRSARRARFGLLAASSTATARRPRGLRAALSFQRHTYDLVGGVVRRTRVEAEPARAESARGRRRRHAREAAHVGRG